MADRTKYTVSITDAVQPGSDGVTLEIGARRLHFTRPMGRKDVKGVLSHEDVALDQRTAVGLVRDGYKLEPDPTADLVKNAEKRAEAKRKAWAEAEKKKATADKSK